VKMVFGELVDTVPIFGSQRKSYVLLGAALMAAGCSSSPHRRRWLHFAKADHLYVLGAMLIAIGTVVQDVVADAMSTEVVSRTDAEATSAQTTTCASSLAWCRCSAGCGLGRRPRRRRSVGWLANFMPRQDVFLIGLIIPAISVAGVFLRGIETMERRPIDWRILGGGIMFGFVVVVLASAAYRSAGGHLCHLDGRGLLYARAGDGGARSQHPSGHPVLHHHRVRLPRRAYGRRRVFLVDPGRAQFRRRVLRTLRQTGAILSIAVMWLFARS